jgi:hypothetical protein
MALRSIFALTLMLTIAGPLAAQAPLRDPNLPTVPPQALKDLSNDRIRQDIMRESQAHYVGRCVCRYQTEDSHRRSCKGRHEVITAKPLPMCYPAQVTDVMIQQWRRSHR